MYRKPPLSVSIAGLPGLLRLDDRQAKELRSKLSESRACVASGNRIKDTDSVCVLLVQSGRYVVFRLVLQERIRERINAYVTPVHTRRMLVTAVQMLLKQGVQLGHIRVVMEKIFPVDKQPRKPLKLKPPSSRRGRKGSKRLIVLAADGRTNGGKRVYWTKRGH